MALLALIRKRRRTRIYDAKNTDDSAAIFGEIDTSLGTLDGRVVAAETMSHAGFKGATATGPTIDLTAAQAATILPVFGTTTKGLVPAPGTSSANALRANGSFSAVTGDVLTGFATAGTRAAITAADSILAAFGKAQKYFVDLSTVAFTGAWSDLTGKPTTVGAAGLTDAVVTTAGTAFFPTAAVVTVAGSVTLGAADVGGVLDYSGVGGDTITFPTGSAINATFAGAPNGTALMLSVINRGSGSVSLAGASGVTLVGALSVAAGTSALWQVRKVATSTYDVRRIAG